MVDHNLPPHTSPFKMGKNVFQCAFLKNVFLSLPHLLISSLSSNEDFGVRNHPSKVSYKVNFKVGHNVKIQRGVMVLWVL